MARVIQRQNLARHHRELATSKNRRNEPPTSDPIHYIPPRNLATGGYILAEVSSTKKI